MAEPGKRSWTVDCLRLSKGCRQHHSLDNVCSSARIVGISDKWLVAQLSPSGQITHPAADWDPTRLVMRNALLAIDKRRSPIRGPGPKGLAK
jgi:hypothetical protein